MTNFEILKREIAKCHSGAKSLETAKVLMYLREFMESNLSNGWVSVDDELPKPMRKVLVCGETYKEKNIIEVSYHVPEFIAEFGVDSSFLSAMYVSHWQPLPEPPEEQ